MAANGTDIKIFGEQEIRGKDDKGHDIMMKLTCADVKKPIASITKIVGKDNKVIFSSAGSYKEN